MKGLLFLLLACYVYALTEQELDTAFAGYVQADTYINGGTYASLSSVYYIKQVVDGKHKYSFGSRFFEMAEGSEGGLGVYGGFAGVTFYLEDVNAAIQAGDGTLLSKIFTDGLDVKYFLAVYHNVLPWHDSNSNDVFDLAINEDHILAPRIFNVSGTQTGINYATAASIPPVTCGATTCKRLYMNASTTTGEKLSLICYFLPSSNFGQTGSMGGYDIDYSSMKCDVELNNLQAISFLTEDYTYSLVSFFYAMTFDYNELVNNAPAFSFGSLKYEWAPTVIINGGQSRNVNVVKLRTTDYAAMKSHVPGLGRDDVDFTSGLNYWSDHYVNTVSQHKRIIPVLPDSFVSMNTFGAGQFTSLSWDPYLQGATSSKSFSNTSDGCTFVVSWLLVVLAMLML